MRSQRMLLLLACLLPACARSTPSPAAATAAATSSAAPLPIDAATEVTATATALAAASPTALAEGLVAGLGTPDPNPNCPDHYPWFFPNRADECAATMLNTWAAFETFEHGVMVWTQEGGHTYVLVDDGSPFKPYQEVTDPGSLPLPDADPSLAPPDGLYQPVLGFGKFWRGLVPGAEWVRARLGWATAPESDYSAFWQCNTASGDAARCYLMGPRDEVLVFARGSAQYWTYWQRAVR